jgi:hypothetical protein
MSPIRPLIAVLASLCALSGAGVAQGAALGTVVVDYNPYPTWDIAPSSLTGATGDTFGLQNNRYNDNGVSYVSLVNASGAVSMGGTACTADTSCPVYDKTSNPKNVGTFTVVTPGALTVRRYLAGSGFSSIGTLTITASAPAPSPGSATVAITSVSPSSGLTTGGEKVTIVGSGFSAGAKPTVTFGGTAATDVTVANETTLTAVTPSRAKGAVDVAVTSGGASATLANGYTYNQGYWLTVKTSRPASTPGLSSIGAVRTVASGDWTSRKGYTSPGLSGFDGDSDMTFSGYQGGINCGGREQRERVVLLRPRIVETVWDGGPCRYAFAAGTRVVLTPLASSSLTQLLPGLMLNESVGFPAVWRNGCTGEGTTCTVSVDSDITASLAWGHARFSVLRVFANVAFPTFGADGSLQYFDAFLKMVTPPAVVGGTPGYFLIASMPVAAASDARSPHAAASTVVCRTSARLVGRQLRARCQVNPALARQLRKGKVRLTAKWQVRLPNTKSARELRTGRIIVSNRRVAVTG